MVLLNLFRRRLKHINPACNVHPRNSSGAIFIRFPSRYGDAREHYFHIKEFIFKVFSAQHFSSFFVPQRSKEVSQDLCRQWLIVSFVMRHARLNGT